MRVIPSSIIGTVALIAPVLVHASDDYTFNLTKPPPYAKEWFSIAREDRAIQKAGSPAKFKDSRYSDLILKLRPEDAAPVDQWAAYHFACQQSLLSRFPDSNYLENLRKTKDSAYSVQLLFIPWAYGDIMNHISFPFDRWIAVRPLGLPDTKPEEIKKLYRYIVKLGAETVAELNSRFLPDWEKRFEHHTTRTDDPFSNKPPARTPEQEEALRLIRVEEEWRRGMKRIHKSFELQLEKMRPNLCALFRTYIPGDKDTIREMLIIAGYKTPEQRKAFWQYCRTNNATWSYWTPADEQRLVTD